MTDEIYATPSATPNFRTELAAQLADLVPEAIADGKVDGQTSLPDASDPVPTSWGSISSHARPPTILNGSSGWTFVTLEKASRTRGR